MIWGGEFGRTPHAQGNDGRDHEKLTYRYAGREFRLTDVKGNVVKEIVA